MSTGMQTAAKPHAAISHNPRVSSLMEEFQSDAMRQRIAEALPKHMTADRMIRMVFTAMTKTPKLMDCTKGSLVLAVLQASQIGVELNGRDAHLVPFRNNKVGCTECQLIVDYKGMIQLAYNSGVVRSISARAVHAKDKFDYEEGTNEHLIYKPYEGNDDPGPLTHAWAMVKLHNGGEKFVVLNARDIAKRKAKSRAKQNWDEYPDQYWAKSAIRELSKWMPQTAELQRFHAALDYDSDQTYGQRTIGAASGNDQNGYAGLLNAANGQDNAATESIDADAPEPDVTDNQVPQTDQSYTEEDMLNDYYEGLRDKQTITAVSEWRLHADQDANLSIDGKAKVSKWCDERIQQIRGSRGGRTGQQTMLDGGASATEMGQ